MSNLDLSLADQPQEDPGKYLVFKWMQLLFLIYIILLAVSVIGDGFKLATGEHATALFEFAQNPLLGLIIGMTATALIQSSSTVTSIIVAMVAGGLPIGIAIPMVMGANIGTSITNTIVSLGHITNKNEFQRAFSAATVHDFFNMLCVVIFLPLEIAFGLLEKISSTVITWLAKIQTSGNGFNPVKAITEPFAERLVSLVSPLSELMGGMILAVAGVGLIVFAITFIGRTMKSLMVGKAKNVLHHAIGKGPVTGIFSGTIVTVMVQSSSTTTSLVVPLVGNGILKTRDIYPFTLGANIGTCITALIASLAVTGEFALVALQIALVHLIYNVLGVAVVFGIKFLREIPLKIAEGLSQRVAEQKILGFAYIASVFFVMPIVAIFASQ
ncbi:Na/Pi symporter [Zhongshania arctica]|uniref:Na/Pi symporter n=1 Tax=Zhongshania arctica TaxID=3238302 RepID=A0ABV3TUJ7_9GAMM